MSHVKTASITTFIYLPSWLQPGTEGSSGLIFTSTKLRYRPVQCNAPLFPPFHCAPGHEP